MLCFPFHTERDVRHVLQVYTHPFFVIGYRFNYTTKHSRTVIAIPPLLVYEYLNDHIIYRQEIQKLEFVKMSVIEELQQILMGFITIMLSLQRAYHML